MSPLTLRAPAKLNLYLHVLGRREDGYHLLDSLVVFTELADTLTIEPAETLSLTVEGEFAEHAGNSDTNLVLKAARALQSKMATPRGAHLRLTKNIPVGAGLGGGSADAAATLRGLNRFWDARLNQQDLRWLASTLGADVPMCLDSSPAIARGIGTELSPVLVHWPEVTLLLVYPRVPLLTQHVYAALRIPSSAPAPWQATFTDAPTWIASLVPTRNDLQPAAIAVHSAVAEVLLALETLQPAADLVRMSGSGACCFAIYRDATDAQKAADAIARSYPQWWVAATKLKSE